MVLDEKTLLLVAQNGEMDYSKWPTMIEPLLDRLNHIVTYNFPLPQPYPNLTPNASISSDQAHHVTGQTNTTLVSQTPTTPRTLPPVPPFPGSASSVSQIPNSQPEASQPAQAVDGERPTSPPLPYILAQLYSAIVTTLRSSFSSDPPHTIQRLAELVLHPTNHYKTLPAFLRALDRVVSVSSAANIFPLSDQPSIVNGTANGEPSGGILWKIDTNGHERSRESDLGSDESLGGALLTPIPWLRDIGPQEQDSHTANGTEPDTDSNLLDSLSQSDSSDPGIDTPQSSLGDSPSHAPIQRALAMPHHDPLVPERQDGAVTQGELIRMEQEAGVIPVTHSSQSTPVRSAGRSEPVPHSIALGVGVGLDELDVDGDDDDDDELSALPHARGPDVVGTVDLGLVDGRDVQLNIASPPDTGLKERGSPVNVNQAQDVLEGPNTTNTTQQSEPDDGDGYVDIGNEMDDVDTMQVDSTDIGNRPASTKDKAVDGDEDIVLVDADGLSESEREKVNSIGGQKGNDAGDTTR